MSNFIFAAQNNRTISGDDKIFGISKLAKEAEAQFGKENVINATIGSLLDKEGKLLILPTILEVLKNLKGEDYADYAPIAGVPEFLEVSKKAVFGNYRPEGFIEAIATPGGTGAIRNTFQNFSEPGDMILTSDWFWAPYATIADELGRSMATYTLFTETGAFNAPAFKLKIDELLEKQDRLVITFNEPAHNPTGFSPSEEEWSRIVEILKDASKDKKKKITFLLDVAYLDFAGAPNTSRTFFSKLSNLPENILVIVAFSMSKGYTLYGMRSGAMIAVTSSEAIADEFKMVSMFSNRGTWSNGTRAAMTALVKVFENQTLKNKIEEERHEFLTLLQNRGHAFVAAAKEAGLNICPFSAGYFITVPCENAEAVGKALQKENVFTVPIGKGIRIAISAISSESCSKLPGLMKKAIDEING